MRILRRRYGSGPLHLLVVVGSLALTAYAVLRLAPDPRFWRIVVWFVGAVLVHDLVILPVYSALDRVAAGGLPRRGVNHVRVPALLSGLLLLLFFPLVFAVAPETYESATDLRPEPYLERWLALTAALFLGSAVLYALRARRARGRARRARGQ
jgi:hypothetical protein